MAQTSSNATSAPRNLGSGYLFNIPIGGLGWFASLLIGVAAGFMAFFAATFCTILFILVYNSAAHATIDFAISYRLVGLPVGLVVMVVALSYLGTLWFKRIRRRS